MTLSLALIAAALWGCFAVLCIIARHTLLILRHVRSIRNHMAKNIVSDIDDADYWKRR